MVLRRMYILWIWGGEFCKCLSGLLFPGLSSSTEYPCIFSLWLICNDDSGVLKSPTIIVWESKSFFRSLRTCFMCPGDPVLGAHIFLIVSSSCCIDPFAIR